MENAIKMDDLGVPLFLETPLLSDFLEALWGFCMLYLVGSFLDFMPIVFKQDLHCQDDQDVIVQNHHRIHGYGYANPPKTKTTTTTPKMIL